MWTCRLAGILRWQAHWKMWWVRIGTATKTQDVFLHENLMRSTFISWLNQLWIQFQRLCGELNHGGAADNYAWTQISATSGSVHTSIYIYFRFSPGTFWVGGFLFRFLSFFILGIPPSCSFLLTGLRTVFVFALGPFLPMVVNFLAP